MIQVRVLVPVALAAIALGAAASTPDAGARSPAGVKASLARACTAPEARQFDFWLGEWDLERSDGARARVRVTSTLDGCMIEEDFDATPGNPLVGRSIASWDPQSGHWKQTWVDNFGSHFAFAGGYDDGRMSMTARYANAGKTSLHRRVWSSITRDSFEWDWVTSDDDGRTWRTAWKFKATRAGAPTASSPSAASSRSPSSAAASPTASLSAAPSPSAASSSDRGSQPPRQAVQSSAPSASSGLAPFAWLEGRWEGTLPNGMHADITYTDARANTIIGIMRLRSASGDSLVMGETILLSATADGITMRANHFSPELRVAEDTAMTLRWVGGTADSLHFVSTHGPTMDTFYLRRGMDEHEARSVIHRPDGRDRIISLTYRRRK